MGTTHDLKCWPEYFEAIWDGRKRFELRLNDRNYQVGDRLHLLEYDPNADAYSGRELWFTNAYQLDIAIAGSPHVIMSLGPNGLGDPSQ